MSVGRPVPVYGKRERHWIYAIVRGSRVIPFRQKVLMHLLLELDNPKDYRGGGSFKSQKNLALDLGTTQPTIARDLGDLERRGLVVRQGGGRRARVWVAMPFHQIVPPLDGGKQQAHWLAGRIEALDNHLRYLDGAVNSDVCPDDIRSIHQGNSDYVHLECPSIPTRHNPRPQIVAAQEPAKTSRTASSSRSSSREPFTVSEAHPTQGVGALPTVAHDNGKNGADAPSGSQSPALRAGVSRGKHLRPPDDWNAFMAQRRASYRGNLNQERSAAACADFAVGMEPVRDAAGNLMGHISTGRVDLDAARATYTRPDIEEPF